MSTTLSKKDGKADRAHDVGVSLYESMIRDIDAIRGDTNRSLWLRRAAAKELERQHKEKLRKNER